MLLTLGVLFAVGAHSLCFSALTKEAVDSLIGNPHSLQLPHTSSIADRCARDYLFGDMRGEAPCELLAHPELSSLFGLAAVVPWHRPLFFEPHGACTLELWFTFLSDPIDVPIGIYPIVRSPAANISYAASMGFCRRRHFKVQAGGDTFYFDARTLVGDVSDPLIPRILTLSAGNPLTLCSGQVGGVLACAEPSPLSGYLSVEGSTPDPIGEAGVVAFYFGAAYAGCLPPASLFEQGISFRRTYGFEFLVPCNAHA